MAGETPSSYGRCKILALNCLVSAYAMSVMHLDGVRLGDTQMTATGIGTAHMRKVANARKVAPATPHPVLL